MAIYAIGAVNGCYQALQQLLGEISFDKDFDTLWFTGDLVKPGADALPVLRFVKDLGKGAVVVLGDQDIEFLALVEGVKSPEHDSNGLTEMLEAPDCKVLLSWLRQRPFLHYDAQLGYMMVHAGIPAEWSFSQARTFAIEAETALAFGDSRVFLDNYFNGKSAKRWHAKLRGWQRNQVISNALTRIQHYTEKGHMKYQDSQEEYNIPESCIPWYQKDERGTAGQNIIFSHNALDSTTVFPGVFPVGSVAGEHASVYRLA